MHLTSELNRTKLKQNKSQSNCVAKRRTEIRNIPVVFKQVLYSACQGNTSHKYSCCNSCYNQHNVCRFLFIFGSLNARCRNKHLSCRCLTWFCLQHSVSWCMILLRRADCNTPVVFLTNEHRFV